MYKIGFYQKVLLLSFIYSSSALSATEKAVLYFKGTLRASPCTVVNDAITFNFGDVNLESFNTTSNWIKTPIKFINCPASTSKVMATFRGTPSEDSPIFGYKNSGTAKNVSIQLDLTGGEKGLGNGRSWEVDVKNGKAEMLLASRLKKAAGATPGSIEAQVQVTFTYN